MVAWSRGPATTYAVRSRTVKTFFFKKTKGWGFNFCGTCKVDATGV